MKGIWCKTLLGAWIGVALSLGAQAQHYVVVQPGRPTTAVVVVPAPRAGYIWIGEEWKWVGGAYVWAGGRWMVPPFANAVWIPGHWRHTKYGWYWLPGEWRKKY
jgi:hypothetical protein